MVDKYKLFTVLLALVTGLGSIGIAIRFGMYVAGLSNVYLGVLAGFALYSPIVLVFWWIVTRAKMDESNG